MGLLGDPGFQEFIDRVTAAASTLPPPVLYAPEVIEAAAAALGDPNNPAYNLSPYEPSREDFVSDEAYERARKSNDEWRQKYAEAVAGGLGQLPTVVLPDLDVVPIADRVQMAGSVIGDEAAEEEAMRQWDAENPIEVKTQE